LMCIMLLLKTDCGKYSLL